MQLKPPIIQINGIDVVLGASIVWNLVAGGNPNLTIISIDDESAKEIWNKGKKITISATYEIGDGDKIDTHTIELKRLILVERRYLNKLFTQLVIADARIMFLNQLITGCYNYRLQDPTIQFKINPNAQGKLPFVDYWLFENQSYLDWSVKPDKSPWKAIEILDMILKTGLKRAFGGWIINDSNGKEKVVSVDSVNWSDAAPDFLAFNALPVSEAINKLSALTRTAVCNHIDGKIYCHKLVDKDKPKSPDMKAFVPNMEWAETDTKLIYKRYMARMMPAVWRVYFKKLIGVPLIFEYKPSTGTTAEIVKEQCSINKKFSGGIDLSKSCTIGTTEDIAIIPMKSDKIVATSGQKVVFGDDNEGIPDEIWGYNNLINVAQCPYTMEITVEGDKKVLYPRGSWIPIQALMKETLIPESSLIKQWYENIWQTVFWANKVGRDGASLPSLVKYDERTKAILQSVSRSWWRTFMIKPNLRRMFDNFIPNDVSMVDWVTSYLQPSPVWCNYIDSPTMQQIQDSSDPNSPEFAEMVNMREDIDQKTIEYILNSECSPFYVHTIDKALGIIEVSEMKDLHNVHYCFEPGTLEKIPSSTPSMGHVNPSECPKKDYYKFVTVMSASPLIPNSLNRDFCIKVNSHNAGSAPDGNIFCDMEVARYGWQEDLADVNNILDLPENLDVLQILASTEVTMQEYRYMPWWVGNMTFLGLHHKNPIANTTISYQLAETYCSTSIMAEVPAPPQELYPLLPDDLRRDLKHELKRVKGETP